MRRSSKRRVLQAADFFCGAGGTSAGLLRALKKLGYQVRLTAVNHWQIACATYSANHADMPLPLCASVDSINPRRICAEGDLDILVASPECTHHSIARGGKPIDDQSRATAWCVVRQAEYLRPLCVLMENVKEFLDWGPLIKLRNPKTGAMEWRPDPKRKGEIFRSWVTCMEAGLRGEVAAFLRGGLWGADDPDPVDCAVPALLRRAAPRDHVAESDARQIQRRS